RKTRFHTNISPAECSTCRSAGTPAHARGSTLVPTFTRQDVWHALFDACDACLGLFGVGEMHDVRPPSPRGESREGLRQLLVPIQDRPQLFRQLEFTFGFELHLQTSLLHGNGLF